MNVVFCSLTEWNQQNTPKIIIFHKFSFFSSNFCSSVCVCVWTAVVRQSSLSCTFASICLLCPAHHTARKHCCLENNSNKMKENNSTCKQKTIATFFSCSLNSITQISLFSRFSMKKRKHRHRRNVTSHHSFSLL